MNTLWAEVSCKVPAAMVDRISEFLVDLSGTGVTIENLSVDTFSLDTLADAPVKTVTAYFPADPALEKNVAQIAAFLVDSGPDFPGFVFHEPDVSFIKEEDWANNWKEHFKPSRIGRKLVIKPTWENYVAGGDDIIIELDPGMAFGTGTHPTTRLCLETMERIFLGDPPFGNGKKTSPTAILDVGTGSGVLAIAAAKLGAGTVVALDVDPEAVAVARRNLDQNRIVIPALVTAKPLAEISGTYDIVLANILAEELIRLGKDLVCKVRPHGYLVLSGILTEKEGFVCQGYAPLPLALVEITREDEWSCLTYFREC
jgi:ribosomal protein L11 methyltransferase